MGIFYERIEKISCYYGFSSVNKFALDGLKYKSSEKINRLRKENTYPSVQILQDISDKFENVNIEWIVTGNHEMIKKSDKKIIKEEKNIAEEVADILKEDLNVILNLVSENGLTLNEIKNKIKKEV